MARRRWLATEWGAGWAALTGSHALHLARVLRAQPGMRFEVAAGEQVWDAVVQRVSEERVEFALQAELPADPALPLTLLLAIFKFDRLEWAIEKATELGVARIVPVVARRTEKHLAQAAVARVERWRRIAVEAAKQSRRADVPAIDSPVPLKEVLAQPWSGVRLLLAERERTVLMQEMLGGDLTAVSLAVGSEGGWTEEEEQLFIEQAWKPVSLGPRILRAETAAIAGIALASSALER